MVVGERVEDAPPFGGKFQHDSAPVVWVMRAGDESGLFAALAEFDDRVVAQAEGPLMRLAAASLWGRYGTALSLAEAVDDAAGDGEELAGLGAEVFEDEIGLEADGEVFGSVVVEATAESGHGLGAVGVEADVE
jgi:hypothetical protein